MFNDWMHLKTVRDLTSGQHLLFGCQLKTEALRTKHRIKNFIHILSLTKLTFSPHLKRIFSLYKL